MTDKRSTLLSYALEKLEAAEPGVREEAHRYLHEYRPNAATEAFARRKLELAGARLSEGDELSDWVLRREMEDTHALGVQGCRAIEFLIATEKPEPGRKPKTYNENLIIYAAYLHARSITGGKFKKPAYESAARRLGITVDMVSNGVKRFKSAVIVSALAVQRILAPYFPEEADRIAINIAKAHRQFAEAMIDTLAGFEADLKALRRSSAKTR